MLLGCIADDFTGATDLANMLVKGGMRTVQMIGVPAAEQKGAANTSLKDVDAVVVALKSRTIAPADAVAQSLAALKWLQASGAAAWARSAICGFWRRALPRSKARGTNTRRRGCSAARTGRYRNLSA